MFQEKSQEKKVKCKKCKEKDATEEDGLCDSCRFMATLSAIIESRKD